MRGSAERRILVRERGRQVLDGVFHRSGLKQCYRPPGVRCPILLYHGVTYDPRPWDVTPDQFRRQINWLSQTFELLSVSEARMRWQNDTLPSRPAVITFDDGLASTIEHALPTLERYGITATHYITPGILGGRFEGASVMTRNGVADLSDRGQDIGAHTMTHPDLTTVTRSRARSEIKQSHDILSKITGKPPSTFAYPYGAFNGDLLPIIANAGYKTATTVIASDITDFESPFTIPRITIMHDHRLKDVKSLTTGSRRWQQLWATLTATFTR